MPLFSNLHSSVHDVLVQLDTDATGSISKANLAQESATEAFKEIEEEFPFFLSLEEVQAVASKQYAWAKNRDTEILCDSICGETVENMLLLYRKCFSIRQALLKELKCTSRLLTLPILSEFLRRIWPILAELNPEIFDSRDAGGKANTEDGVDLIQLTANCMLEDSGRVKSGLSWDAFLKQSGLQECKKLNRLYRSVESVFQEIVGKGNTMLKKCDITEFLAALEPVCSLSSLIAEDFDVETRLFPIDGKNVCAWPRVRDWIFGLLQMKFRSRSDPIIGEVEGSSSTTDVSNDDSEIDANDTEGISAVVEDIEEMEEVLPIEDVESKESSVSVSPDAMTIPFHSDVSSSDRRKFDSLRLRKMEQSAEENAADNGGMYVDPNFRADVTYTNSKGNKCKCPTVRLCQSKAFTSVFDDESGPSDEHVSQGRLGDCWLIASFATLAEANLVRDLFLICRPDIGYFCVCIHVRDAWQVVEIDDAVPTYPSSHRRHSRLLFASMPKGVIWAPLLEKAFAKVFGSYPSLRGGYEVEALEDLSGGLGWGISWKKLSEKKSAASSSRFREFKRLRQSGILMCASASKTQKIEGEQFSTSGIMLGHAYSLLRLEEVHDHKLVKLRNPWGHGEWNGPWSDQADEWKKFPDVAKSLEHTSADDGGFWMSWKDFAKWYTHIDFVRVPDAFVSSQNSLTNVKMVSQTNRFSPSWGTYQNYKGNPRYLVQSDVDQIVVIHLAQRDPRAAVDPSDNLQSQGPLSSLYILASTASQKSVVLDCRFVRKVRGAGHRIPLKAGVEYHVCPLLYGAISTEERFTIRCMYEYPLRKALVLSDSSSTLGDPEASVELHIPSNLSRGLRSCVGPQVSFFSKKDCLIDFNVNILSPQILPTGCNVEALVLKVRRLQSSSKRVRCKSATGYRACASVSDSSRVALSFKCESEWLYCLLVTTSVKGLDLRCCVEARCDSEFAGDIQVSVV